MRRIFVFVFLLFAVSASSQKLIRGQVLDAQGSKPVPNASIFLSTTSIGTKANEEGQFQLSIPAGKFDLVVSCIGFETFSATIIASEQPEFIEVKLNPRAEEMDTVVVEPYEKDGWEKWGNFFIDNFIGTSAFAKTCEIKNRDVIRFRDSKAKHTVYAYAVEPLIIENKALGYRVTYQLEKFSYDLNTHFLYYAGYPFFEELESDPYKLKRIEKNRKEAFYGSMTHFMRAVFFNKITQEGFEVRAVRRLWNLERMRVNKLIDSLNKISETPGKMASISNDSLHYYKEVMKQKTVRDSIGIKILTGDSIAYAVNQGTAALAFEDQLMVTYKKHMAPQEFHPGVFDNSGQRMVSFIKLVDNHPVEIQSTGSYYSPLDLITVGYWAWSEKIGMLLPFNYQPPKE